MIRRTSFKTLARVEVEHTDEFLGAHVELADGVLVRPGDQVRVHGDPIHVPFGERRSFQRTATVSRAGALERWWTRLAGYFEMTELYEVSFSDRRLP